MKIDINEWKTKESHPPAPRILIYGDKGSGKSTFCKSVPNCVVLDTEGGAQWPMPSEVLRPGTNVVSPPLLMWKEQIGALSDAPFGDDSKKFICIDSLDWMMGALEKSVAGVSPGNGGSMTKTLNQAYGGYGNGKQVMMNYVTHGLQARVDGLRARGIGVIMTAHLAWYTGKDESGFAVDRLGPAMRRDISEKIEEWVDFIGLVRRGADGRRVLCMEQTGSVTAKHRVAVPSEIDFNFGALMGAIYGGK